MAEEDQLIAGRYRLFARVGSGAMGVVWRAEDETLRRTVALKQVRLPSGVDDQTRDQAYRRVMREGRLFARLHHPNAIAVFDVVDHEAQPWLVMEYLPSRSLSEAVAARGVLSPLAAASVGHQIAAALTAAHTAGIVHRDVKPGNVLLGHDGVVKVTDFGISRAIDEATITSTGMMAGTPAYLAPEVARGADADFRSDVYSLGSTIYAAVEGEPPFGQGENALAQLHRVATGEYAPPRRAGNLTALLERLLADDPARRPEMHQVRDELGRLAAVEAETEEWTEDWPPPTSPTLPVPPSADDAGHEAAGAAPGDGSAEGGGSESGPGSGGPGSGGPGIGGPGHERTGVDEDGEGADRSRSGVVPLVAGAAAGAAGAGAAAGAAGAAAAAGAAGAGPAGDRAGSGPHPGRPATPQRSDDGAPRSGPPTGPRGVDVRPGAGGGGSRPGPRPVDTRPGPQVAGTRSGPPTGPQSGGPRSGPDGGPRGTSAAQPGPPVGQAGGPPRPGGAVDPHGSGPTPDGGGRVAVAAGPASTPPTRPQATNPATTAPAAAGRPSDTAVSPSDERDDAEGGGDTRRRRGRLLAVGLAVLVVAAVVAVVLVVGTRGNDGASTASGPAPTTANAGGAAPATDQAGSGSAPAPAPASGSGGGSAGDGGPGSAVAPAQGTSEQVAQQQAIVDYYGLIPNNLQEGWQRLTPDYQRNTAGGFGGYSRFWGAMRQVTVRGVSPGAGSSVDATVTYVYQDGRTTEERTLFRMVQQDGIWKIDGSQVLSSR